MTRQSVPQQSSSDVVNGITLPRNEAGDLPVVVEVRGDAALFSRPELKVERVSYPIMTPPAAVGVLEAIYWKPEFRYRIVAIELLAPIRQFTVRRNETSDIAPLVDALKGTRRVDTAAHRDQRNAVCLKDVAYRIHAHLDLAPHADKPPAAYRDQMRRRVVKGACFQRPYLGTREFAADFGPADPAAPRLDHTEDLGVMIHTIHRREAGHIEMEWFTARIDGGVMYVPPRGIAMALPTVGAA